MSFFKALKEKIDEKLEKMAKANQEEFGNSVPDCCKMNDQRKN